MAATVHQIAVKTPQAAFQAAPIEPEMKSLLGRVLEAGVLIGEQQTYIRLGIPQPPISLPALDEHTAAACAAILSASRRPCTLCGGHGQVVEGHDCPRCGGSGQEP